MAPRLSGQTSIFGVVFFVSKSPLGIEGQKKLDKFAILTRKPRSRAWILIYRTWPVYNGLNCGGNFEGPVLFWFDYLFFTSFIPTLATVKTLNSLGLKQTLTWNISYPCRSILLTFCTREGRVRQMQASFTLCTRALPSPASHWMTKMKKPGSGWPSCERKWSGWEVWKGGKTRASRLLF